jgi:hypothetical protein
VVEEDNCFRTQAPTIDKQEVYDTTASAKMSRPSVGKTNSRKLISSA